MAAQMYRQLDPVLGRALSFAKFELIYGAAELLLELSTRLQSVTDQQIRTAAAQLAPRHRAVLELIPGGAR